MTIKGKAWSRYTIDFAGGFFFNTNAKAEQM